MNFSFKASNVAKLPDRCFACQRATGPSSVMPNSAILDRSASGSVNLCEHDLLPMFVGTHKRAPPHQDRPGTSDMGTAWCSLRKVVPGVCILFLALSVVAMVCDL